METLCTSTFEMSVTFEFTYGGQCQCIRLASLNRNTVCACAYMRVLCVCAFVTMSMSITRPVRNAAENPQRGRRNSLQQAEGRKLAQGKKQCETGDNATRRTQNDFEQSRAFHVLYWPQCRKKQHCHNECRRVHPWGYAIGSANYI